jgi:hypothetical protein
MKMKVGNGLAKAQDINLPDPGKAQNCLNGQVQNFTVGSHPISWDGSHLISS